MEVLLDLEDNLKKRGFKEYYTIADSIGGFKFNEIMGFRSAFEIRADVYEVMVKDLT